MAKKKTYNTGDFRRSWDRVFWYHLEVCNSLDAMAKLLENLEKSWVSLQTDMRNDIKGFYQEMEKQGYYGGNHPYTLDEMLIDEIKARGYFAVFLASYSILESSLYKISIKIEEEFDFIIKLVDLDSRDHLDHYKTYLKKAYGIELTIFDKYWPNLKKYTKLRNILTHRDGKSKKLTEKETNILKSFKNLKVFEDKYGTTVILQDKKFIEVFLEILNRFFFELFNEIDKRYGQIKKG